MGIKNRLSSFINQILTNYDINQKELSELLGIKPSRLSAYIKAKETPGIAVILKLAEIGGLTTDDLLKTDKPPEKKVLSIPTIDNSSKISITTSGNSMVGGGIVHGDVFQNTSVRKTYKYTYQPGDLTEEQAAKLHKHVEEIINLENTVKRTPKSYAAVWNALKRRFKVAYYRRIREEDFNKAVAYFQSWKGRLLRAKSLPKKDSDLHRKHRYKSIFAIATKELGMRKADVDNLIYDRYSKPSIKDLTTKELDGLYGYMNKMKKG